MELDGTILGKFGHAGKQIGQFSTIHEMDCRSENELTVSEIGGWRVQRVILHPNGNKKESLMRSNFYSSLRRGSTAQSRGSLLAQSAPEITFRFLAQPVSSFPSIFIWAKRPGWRRIPKDMFSSTRVPATRTRPPGPPGRLCTAASRLFEFDPDRKIRARDRPGVLRISLRPVGAGRSSGQYLDR